MIAPNSAVAQQHVAASPASVVELSGPWFVGGIALAVSHINCQLCGESFPHRRAASVLATVGYRVNRQMNVGGEVFWIPTNTPAGSVQTTHVDTVAQYRPWSGHGFFVKGGAGMAFVRNWIDVDGTSAVTSKALSLVIGTGWEFRRAARVGYQLFATQHATALGDVQTTQGEVQNVLANFWTLGAAIVIR